MKTQSVPEFPGLSRVVPLASGAMGSVYAAWQDELGRRVAVKTLRAELRDEAPQKTPQKARLAEQFVREARILASLDHPGIVAVHEAGRTELGPYYVMRFVHGQTIERSLDGRPPREVAQVFADVARALATAHRAGVLHRDIKPANVLVEAGGRAVLVDFGLATRTGATGAEDGLVGTLDYVAPELLEGASASMASDVYALGVTLYTTLTGRVPFPAAEVDEKLRSILEDDPLPPRALRVNVPRALQAICLKAMERAPGDRYASANDMARDLARFVAGDVVQAFPVRTRSLLRRKIQLHLADHADWARQGLIDDMQRAALEERYEHLDERQRGLLRGVFGSLPNLLLLVGILLSVFGPTLLALLTWEQQGPLFRIGLQALPFALLLVLGGWRARREDRPRALAAWLGAALLAAPLAFTLADLVPALRTVVDAQGVAHAILPGDLWLPRDEAEPWMQTGAWLLSWKLLLTSAGTLALALELFRRTRAAAFLWFVGLAGSGAAVCAARVAGWALLAPGWRWLLAGLGVLALAALGRAFDRSFQRDRALPFYGLAFLAALMVAPTYAELDLPMAFFGVAPQPSGVSWSLALHGLGFVTLGCVLHARGTALLRPLASLPLLAGLVFTLAAFAALSTQHFVVYELLLVGACVGHLVLGLALQRNALVLPAAVLLPFVIGAVSQRHVQALWAWSAAVLSGGALMIWLSFRLGAHRPPAGTVRRALGDPGS